MEAQPPRRTSMSISYLKVQKKPTIFCRLFGVSVEQFEEIFSKVSPQWQRRVVSAYKRPTFKAGKEFKAAVS